MLVVIQCAAGKQPHAGHLRTRDGRKVMLAAAAFEVAVVAARQSARE